MIYNFHGGTYRTAIHDDAIVVHHHGEGRDLTNQQPCTTILSDAAWMMCWTQATEEAAKNESVVGATSEDGGLTWTDPYFIEEAVDERTASWGMLFAVPHTSRVYCFYWFNENAYWLRDAGSIYFRFTEDAGKRWSDRRRIDIPRHKLDGDHPEMHGWNTGFPILTRGGAMLLGFSKINEASMIREVPGHHYGDADLWYSECFFLRCPNILLENDPDKLEFRVTPEDDEGLWAPHRDDPERHFLQEPYMALLPSGRNIATMRSRTGHPMFSISMDDGIQWAPAAPLRFAPGGDRMKHPCGPCPILCTRDGRIVLCFRNDNAPTDAPHLKYWDNRDPHHVSVSVEMPALAAGFAAEEANGGLYFDSPKVLLSHVVLPPGSRVPRRRAEYPQLLEWAGRFFVVYSSKKVDIMLKQIPAEMFAGCGLP